MLQLWWEDCIDKGWVWQVLRQWKACSNSRSSSSNSIGALAMITRSSTAIHPASATHPQPPPAHPRPAVTSGAGLSTDTKIQPQRFDLQTSTIIDLTRSCAEPATPLLQICHSRCSHAHSNKPFTAPSSTIFATHPLPPPARPLPAVTSGAPCSTR